MYLRRFALIGLAGILSCCTLHAAEPASPPSDTAALETTALETTASETTASEPPGARKFQGRSGFFLRLAPRPVRTEEERQAHIASLREAYGKPPAEWPAPQVDAGVEWKELGLLPDVEHPADNPFSKEKAELGKMLFFDPRLSGSGQLACASCHDPELGWTDGRSLPFGNARLQLRRNSPSVLNAGHARTLFWDGRAGSLEEQARAVLLNPEEMHADAAVIEERLAQNEAYRARFKEVFGSERITLDEVTKAIAAFERTIVGGRSRFDAFLKGNAKALSDEALVGLDLFRTHARCINCHHGPTFSDDRLHDVGLSYYGRALEDLGKYQVTSLAEDVGKFKTPSLRNVASTAPYMHNGLFPLTGVLNMYNAGMPTLTRTEAQQEDALFPTKSPLLKPLGLNAQDLADLKAFLEALSEPPLRMRPPALPGLHVKS